jgi:hypothetical protein
MFSVIRDEILALINAYVADRASLRMLTEMVDDYDWNEEVRTSSLEWEVMGTVALYVHEIAEGFRAEEELKETLRAFQIASATP